jgi:23S rRNA pseudouridine1911/1915/1917 synthase
MTATKEESFELTVHAADAGKRLDVVLADAGRGLTRSRAKQLIAEGLVLIDGLRPAKAGIELRLGQTVRVSLPEARKLDLEPVEMGLRVLFEDDELAVIDKPAGISVHPSTTETGATLVHGLLQQLKGRLSQVGGVERPGIVHRLDKGTSGILVVSKTDRAHAALSAQFKAHSIDRRYYALVYGEMGARAPSGRIETHFGRHPVHRKKMTGKLTKGRKAITNWRVVERMAGKLTLVECRLETGRTHQIRVHLSEAGFPIVGDPVYGDHERRAKSLTRDNPELSRACLALKRQMLHAWRLAFAHPVTQKPLEFESEPPADFASIVTLARH